MREFKQIAELNSKITDTLKREYGIKNGRVHISGETEVKILTSHGSEFRGIISAADFSADIIRNATIVQRNEYHDTVRIIARNRDLDNPASMLAGERYLYLILRLSNKHTVNFIKSVYPSRKLKRGEILYGASETS